jgi:Gpi18-like mannosyltransferase
MNTKTPEHGTNPTPAGIGKAQGTQLLALILIIGTALALRMLVLDRTNLDLIDHFLPWLADMRAKGFWVAVSRPFSPYGYTPFYSYAIGLADALLPAGTDGKTVIKSVSILFDFVAAGLVFAIARLRWGNGWQPVAAFAAMLFAPTVFLNGAYWGQSDIVYTTFLMAAVYLLLIKKDFWAMVCFGMALAIKLQAAWLGPFFLMMMLRGRIRWWLMILPPIVYALVALPAVLAGRSLVEIASIYLTQAGTQSGLNYGAANLMFFPHYFFSHLGWWPEGVPIVAKAAIVFTAAMGLLFAWKTSRGKIEDETLLMAALVSVLILPQFLPYMHNRYFFTADVFTIVLAAWRPAYWPAAVMMQFNSIVTYLSFLWPHMLDYPVPGWLAIFGFTNNLQLVTGMIAFAGIVNFLLLVWFWRRLRQLLQQPAGTIRNTPHV